MQMHATTLTVLSALMLGGFVIDDHAAAIDLNVPTRKLGGAGEINKFVCRPRVVSWAGGKRSCGRDAAYYMVRARENWARDVRAAYGTGFVQWSLAGQQRGACTTRYINIKCSVAATPCMLAR